MDRGAVLSKTPLFKGCPIEDLAELSAALKPRTYPKRTFVFREGDPGNAFFIVSSGQVKIGRLGPGGEEVVFAVLNPGDSFGELALLEDDPVRVADAQAVEASECLTLGRDAFNSFLDRHPSTTRRLIQVLIGYIRATDASLAETAFLDIPGRVATKLLELAESHGEKVAGGTRIDLKLSQRTLAGMVAASRENVNRALSRFQSQGVISQEGGYITIRHPDRLARRA
jgi:CRP/FNR family transcriptional regulator/CRP/FNR family cyclic AMP-dependent transcriptional regulator